MSTTENVSVIEEKKTEENNNGNKDNPDFKGFATSYISSIFFTISIGVFVIGTIGLYTTKIAQSNILPDDVSLAPFTEIDRVVKELSIDINVIKPSIMAEAKDCFSQKALFLSQEYLDSFNKSFLCNLKQYADPNSGMFSNAPLFFSNVCDNLVAKNFLAINNIFYYLSFLPEPLIMLVYAMFGIFIWIGLYFFNLCISIFYHFINIPQLFRTASESNAKLWESSEKISFLRFTKLVLFFFLWAPIGVMSSFLMPFFFTIYGLISPLFATYNIKQTNNNVGSKKTFNIFDFIKDTFYYKKHFFFILATLSLVSNGTKYLGSNAIVGIAIAIVFSYFMGLYNNDMPNIGINGFTPKIRETAKQATVKNIKTNLVKVCSKIPVEIEDVSKIITGTFRDLTKPKTYGGDNVEAGNLANNLNEEPKQPKVNISEIELTPYKHKITNNDDNNSDNDSDNDNDNVIDNVIDNDAPGLIKTQHINQNLPNVATPMETNATQMEPNSTPMDTNDTAIDTNSTPMEPIEPIEPIDANSTPMKTNATPMDTNVTPMDTNATPMDTNDTPMEPINGNNANEKLNLNEVLTPSYKINQYGGKKVKMKTRKSYSRI